MLPARGSNKMKKASRLPTRLFAVLKIFSLDCISKALQIFVVLNNRKFYKIYKLKNPHEQ